ncbi:lipase [Sporodiniella umbellata]|nr:lipase [Sporodiniella umbellata]
MVSFISISQGVSLCLLVSSMMMGSSAVPVSGKTGASDSSVSVSGNFTLPPVILASSDLSSEPYFIKKNTDCKRDDNEVGGMTLDLPENVPAIPKLHQDGSYAGVAATAYCRSVVPGNKWNCKQCKKWVPDGKLITTFTSLLSDTNGYVLRSDKDKTIYLVFRGTNSFRSAITDIVFNFSNYKPVRGAKVHAGFLSSYEQVVNDYFPVMQEQLTAYPGYQVIVSGHSLGGAQALLAGMDLYQRESRLSPKNLSIYTIGGPRVGNPTFAYYVESTGIPFYRTVHQRDVHGFLHPGVESWIKSGVNNVQICNSNIETKDCSNSIVPFTSLLDHLSYFGINEGSCL